MDANCLRLWIVCRDPSEIGWGCDRDHIYWATKDIIWRDESWLLGHWDRRHQRLHCTSLGHAFSRSREKILSKRLTTARWTYPNDDITKSIPSYREPLKNMPICEKRAPLWCCRVECIDLVILSSAPSIKRQRKMWILGYKSIEFQWPGRNFLCEMFWKEWGSIWNVESHI
jgi:hypothetical protein